MDFNRVAVFVRVVEERGFTAAAKALALPKSSVSRAVALLEQEVGARLLRRSTRKVALTEAGAAFYERAARGLSALVEAREAVVDLESSVRGPIRITTATDAGFWLLAPIVAAFLERHPDVRIETVLTGRVVDLVEEGFDLALRFGTVKDGSLVARKLPALDLALYAAPKYLAAHGTPKRVRDLASHRCLLFRASRGRATWTLQGPRGQESVDVTGPVSADDLSFIRETALAGAGIAQLPAFAIAGVPRELTRVLPKHSVLGAPAALVYPSARYVPHRVALFRDFVLEAFHARPR